MTNPAKVTGIFLVFATIALLVFVALVTPIWWYTGPNVTFQRAVHGHMENAYYANTPELMIENLQKARAGMQSLGLTPNDYGGLFPWHKTPDRRMDYQFAHIDSIIRRAEAVRDDRDRQEREGTSDQFGDVYETKMDNLRAFLQEGGWADDIAYEAWKAKSHTFFAFLTTGLGWLSVIAATVLLGGSGIGLLAVTSDNRNHW